MLHTNKGTTRQVVDVLLWLIAISCVVILAILIINQEDEKEIVDDDKKVIYINVINHYHNCTSNKEK